MHEISEPMFPNRTNSLKGGRRVHARDAFIEGIAVNGHGRTPRERRMRCYLVAGWVLLAAKCAAVWWACAEYEAPFHPLWIVGPTVLFGALCTLVWWRRRVT
ncbi:hypothetical protein OH491_22720 [Termitidicoccus mucosus]|uniref:Uncharacterized protein n=1 Tax=Termitidicoccus mucosus TaxID=1184151 RepID=A0A178IN74_9BACT|nr:hypothetical protein AW736_03750 [Opitutaceae bacterium TSB47]